MLCISMFQAKAQEELTPLTSQPVLFHKKGTTPLRTKSIESVKLPFIDDFSKDDYRPQSSLWADQNVVINRSFGKDIISIGVATFDAVDQNGDVYSHAGPASQSMDTLTSRGIRLDSAFTTIPFALKASDSIYLSFFVQPQGYGNKPEQEDSLILEFYKPLQNKWNSVWNHEGSSLTDFIAKYDTSFQLFMIPVIDTAYLHDGFRFRFVNYGSTADNTIPSFRSGMYDHWNLDYIVLDHSRTRLDSNFEDIAIRTQHKSILTNYISMPWNQYIVNPAAEVNTNFKYVFKNLDNNPGIKNIDQYFSILNLFNHIPYKDNPYPASINLFPNQEVTYSTQHTSAALTSLSSPYADFEVLFNLRNNTQPDIILQNDTLRFYQRFYNYYAYDDGHPEMGYGLSTSNGRVAYKFSLNTPDSLQSIQMYFNNTIGNASQQYFFLTVWDDNNGQPGNVIYEKAGLRPEYDSEIFKYITYELENPILVNGTFYIGWRKTTGDNLNVGFDQYSNHQTEIYYATGGAWSTSSYQGSLMLRPILGSSKQAYVGIESPTTKEADFSIYPNPAKDNILYIKGDESVLSDGNTTIQIFHSNGQLIYNSKYSNSIDISELSQGIYFVSLVNNQKQIRIHKKLIVIN